MKPPDAVRRGTEAMAAKPITENPTEMRLIEGVVYLPVFADGIHNRVVPKGAVSWEAKPDDRILDIK